MKDAFLTREQFENFLTAQYNINKLNNDLIGNLLKEMERLAGLIKDYNKGNE